MPKSRRNRLGACRRTAEHDALFVDLSSSPLTWNWHAVTLSKVKKKTKEWKEKTINSVRELVDG